MRTAGFPCRVMDCEHVVQVVDQRSMDALKAGSAARAAHEESAHDYHHVKPVSEPSYSPYQRAKVKPGETATVRPAGSA